MTLSIKNPEAHKLAKALQWETGETMTQAVTEALRERLARVRRQSKLEATAEELLTTSRRCASALKGRAVDHGTLLYDERGLQRRLRRLQRYSRFCSTNATPKPTRAPSARRNRAECRLLASWKRRSW